MSDQETTAEQPLVNDAKPMDWMAENLKKARRAFWDQFPTPEARSQVIRERLAKARARKLAAAAKAEHKSRVSGVKPAAEMKDDALQHSAAHGIHELRIMLGDMLDLLDPINADGISGAAMSKDGRPRSRAVLFAAISRIKAQMDFIQSWQF
jgi:hypothetical protein